MTNILFILVVVVLSVLYVWSLYNIPILAVGLKHLLKTKRKRDTTAKPNSKKLPTFSIIVPVKDEEKVVGRLLNSLLKLDYPSEKKDIIVVEDGSKDRTAKICAEYAAQYSDQIRLVHQSVSNGKPSALNYALKHVKGEIVAVFDADNVLEPDLLFRAAGYFEGSSVTAVQGRACSINSDENMLARFISYEEMVRYETYIRGKDSLNLFVPLTGSCYFIRRSVLEDVGGWDDQALSEDMEMAARLTENNHNIKYASDVRSWQENPSSLAQLFRQRLRWFRGSMEVSLKYGRLLKHLNKKSFDAEVTLSGPYMFLPCVLGYMLGLVSLVFPFSPDPVLTLMSQGLAAVNTITLALIGTALVYLTKPMKMRNLLWLPFVYAYWMVQNLVALCAFFQVIFKRSRKWNKTAKTGAVDIGNIVVQASL
jgi:cellulose synthase/poly-beta-1,6-N-acetylglucosamine synthase-like glycosyltransferase